MPGEKNLFKCASYITKCLWLFSFPWQVFTSPSLFTKTRTSSWLSPLLLPFSYPTSSACFHLQTDSCFPRFSMSIKHSRDLSRLRCAGLSLHQQTGGLSCTSSLSLAPCVCALSAVPRECFVPVIPKEDWKAKIAEYWRGRGCLPHVGNVGMVPALSCCSSWWIEQVPPHAKGNALWKFGVTLSMLLLTGI